MTKLYEPEFLFLKQEDVIAAGALDMAATIDDVELAYKLFASGDMIQPHKPVFRFENPEDRQRKTLPCSVDARLCGWRSQPHWA